MSATAAVQQNNNEEPGLNGKLFLVNTVVAEAVYVVYVLMLFCFLLAYLPSVLNSIMQHLLFHIG